MSAAEMTTAEYAKFLKKEIRKQQNKTLPFGRSFFKNKDGKRAK